MILSTFVERVWESGHMRMGGLGARLHVPRRRLHRPIARRGRGRDRFAKCIIFVPTTSGWPEPDTLVPVVGRAAQRDCPRSHVQPNSHEQQTRGDALRAG
jgi:hypothetical protein